MGFGLVYTTHAWALFWFTSRAHKHKHTHTTVTSYVTRKSRERKAHRSFFFFFLVTRDEQIKSNDNVAPSTKRVAPKGVLPPADFALIPFSLTSPLRVGLLRSTRIKVQDMFRKRTHRSCFVYHRCHIRDVEKDKVTRSMGRVASKILSHNNVPVSAPLGVGVYFDLFDYLGSFLLQFSSFYSRKKMSSLFYQVFQHAMRHVTW